MKVYVVVSTEDFSVYEEKVYTNREDAEKVKETLNADWNLFCDFHVHEYELL